MILALLPSGYKHPFLVAAPASAIRGEEQSASLPAAEDVRPAFPGCHFYGEPSCRKPAESRAELQTEAGHCWLRWVLSHAALLHHVESTPGKSNDVRSRSGVVQQDNVTPKPSDQPKEVTAWTEISICVGSSSSSRTSRGDRGAKSWALRNAGKSSALVWSLQPGE